jgi:hypothetical protein
MIVQFKLNIERCSEFVGSKFKGELVGAAAAIRTRTAPADVEPRTPVNGSNKVNVIIWKEECTNFKCKGHSWAHTNPRFFNMVLGQYTLETKAKIEGQDNWPIILELQDCMDLIKALYLLSNQQDGGSIELMEIVTLEHSLALN